MAVKRKEITIIFKEISRLEFLQKLLKTCARKIIAREIQNIKKLKINKYCKAFITAFKPVNIKLNNFTFLDPFFWNSSDFFFGNPGKLFKYIPDF